MMSGAGSAPWIAMPAQMDPDGDKQYLSRQYPDAISAAGGLPVIVPLLASPGAARQAAEEAHGILLTGSNSDLDPALYGAARLDACGPTQALRDRTDFELLETAMRRKIPILAICFGIQSLNVFLGGSLIQDIPSIVGAKIGHGNPAPGGTPSHRITIASGSILETLAGGPEANVNSTHHQAVEKPGLGLDVIARAPDGVIEAVIGTDTSHWILGVQWHPEKSFAQDPFSRCLFEYFIAQSRAARGMNEGSYS